MSRSAGAIGISAVRGPRRVGERRWRFARTRPRTLADPHGPHRSTVAIQVSERHRPHGLRGAASERLEGRFALPRVRFTNHILHNR
jgi:hypothetical protein